MVLRKVVFEAVLGILFAGTIALGQQPPPSTSSQEGEVNRDRIERKERQRERLGRREERMGHRGLKRERMGQFLSELNLSEQQRQQQRAIVERRLESIKAQREELVRMREKRIAGTFTAEDEVRVKALRQEIRTAMEGTRTEVETVLTAEQRARLEELQKERKARMEQRMQERQQRMQERQNNRQQQF